MTTYPKWTEAEDDMVRQLYPTLGARGTTEELRKAHCMRTEGAVKERAKTLKVKRDRSLMSHDGAWKDEELAIIAETFPKGGAEAAVSTLRAAGYDRTVGAVSTRASMLGLRKERTKRRMQRSGDTVLMNFCLDSELDEDVIRKLNAQPNRSAYIRKLVENDIE